MAQFTKYTGTVDGTVGSLITALDAILVTGEGWTKAYSGTNKAAYQPAGGNQFYLRVQDDGPGAGGAREARITGYETMSDVDTGTGPFPTAAQGVGGVAMLVARKSSTLDGTGRSYKAWADDRTLYFFCISEAGGTNYFCFAFGDFYSFVNSDGYRTFLTGRGVENSSASTSERMCEVTASIGSSNNGFFASRAYTGTGTSVLLGKHSDSAKMNAATNFSGVVAYPNPSDGGLYLGRVWMHDAVTAPNYSIRGRLRGLWVPFHAAASFADGDTVSGVGDTSGKTFEMVKGVTNSAGTVGVAVIETSDTLETN